MPESELPQLQRCGNGGGFRFAPVDLGSRMHLARPFKTHPERVICFQSGGGRMLIHKDGDIIDRPTTYEQINARADGTLVEVFVAGDLIYKAPTPYQFTSIKREFPITMGGRLYLFVDEWLPLIFGHKPMIPIRRALADERPENLPTVAKQYPGLAALTTNTSYLHWLILCKLQYDRLRNIFRSNIPEAAMVMMRQLNGNLFPFVIQQRIERSEEHTSELQSLRHL